MNNNGLMVVPIKFQTIGWFWDIENMRLACVWSGDEFIVARQVCGFNSLPWTEVGCSKHVAYVGDKTQKASFRGLPSPAPEAGGISKSETPLFESIDGRLSVAPV